MNFEAITAPHRALTRSHMTAGLWLILNDTTELIFGYRRDIEGIGRVGREDGRGFFLHTALARQAVTGELAGVHSSMDVPPARSSVRGSPQRHGEH